MPVCRIVRLLPPVVVVGSRGGGSMTGSGWPASGAPLRERDFLRGLIGEWQRRIDAGGSL